MMRSCDKVGLDAVDLCTRAFIVLDVNIYL